MKNRKKRSTWLSSLLTVNVLSICLLFSFTFNGLCASYSPELTAEEVKKLNEFSKNIPVDEGVGQFFMVNLPINYKDSFSGKDYSISRKDGKYPLAAHKYLIEEGFGSVLLQKSNFTELDRNAETEEERISLITSFVNNLQYRAISPDNKGVNIPLFVAVDFEGPMTNTIKNVLIPPPPALTLATTKDKHLLEMTGGIVGYQLANSGINMLLGPVLDIDKTPQGTYNDSLLNRSFSSSADGVIYSAAYYIKGLREAGITVIGKHFPGLGLVDGNPHRDIVSFQGTIKNFKEHLRPYNELKPLLNGIMTSHVSLPFSFLKSDEPATFNNSIIQFIRDQDVSNESEVKSMNYNDKLIITDDLGMKAIAKHGRYDYASMAIKAIDAGHDIVMFARVLTRKEQNKTGGIRIHQLMTVKKKLADYLKLNGNEKKYIRPLQRIIRAKAAAYKLRGGNIDNFIAGKMNKLIRSHVFPPDSVRGKDGSLDYEKVKSTYEEIISKAYLLISNGYPYSIEKSNNICVFLPKEHQDSFNGIKSLYENKIHISNHLYGNKKKGYLKEKNVTHDFIKDNECEVIFEVINNSKSIDHAIDIIEILKKMKNDRARLILLLHQTPLSLPNTIINNKNVTVMGAFTDHEIAYNMDVKAIKNDISPKNISQLTVDFNNENFPLNIEMPSIKNMKLDYFISNSDSGDKKINREGSNCNDEVKEVKLKEKKYFFSENRFFIFVVLLFFLMVTMIIYVLIKLAKIIRSERNL